MEEFEAYYTLKAMFSNDVNKYIIVVFTGGDVLSQGNKTIEVVLKEAADALDRNAVAGSKAGRANMPDMRKILRDVSNNYVVFSNTGDAATKEQQILALLTKVKEMVNNNGDRSCFQDDSTRAAWRVMEDELERIMKEKRMDRQQAWLELQRRLEKKERDGQTFLRRVTIAMAAAGGTAGGVGAVMTGVGALVLGAPLAPVAAAVGAGVAGGAAVGYVGKKYCSIM